MKSAKLVGLMAVGALALSYGMAQASEGPSFYAGVGYSHMTFEGTRDYELPTTTFHVGMELSPNLQIEGRYGINAGDDEQFYTESDGVYYASVSETIETTAYWAVLAKVQFPITKSFSVYGLAGLNHLALESSGKYEETSIYGNYYSSGTFKGKKEETGVTYGAGAQLKLGESFALTGEYQVVMDDVSGFNVGLSYRF